MRLALGGVSKGLVQIAAIVMLGAALSACSTVPGWVDPTTWIGGDDSSDTASDDQGLPADQSADADQQTDQGSDQTPDQQIDDQGGDSSQPGLAAIPDRPAPSSTPQERQQVADSLAADRSRQRYSGEQLRGDSQSTAPPPQQEAPQPQQPAQVATATLAPVQTASTQTASTPAASAPVQTGTQMAAVASAPAAKYAPSAPAPVYSTSGGEPAVPATSTGIVSAGPPTTDEQLGFQPSKAPPLDPAVAQFVPPSILARYQQTATVDPGTAIAAPASPAVPAVGAAEGGMGGPEAMSGAVVANLDAIQSQPAGAQESAYADLAGLPPSQVVFFPHDTTVLNAEARRLVRAAADAYRSKGASGYVRVVGHSSSRTANMPLARHLAYNFERSQARATAVAKELIRDGVPAEKVLVEAVGDSQPVYYESMPQGEEGNRRAEIFIQG